MPEPILSLESVAETKQIPSVDRFVRRDLDRQINEYLTLGWRIIDRWIVGYRSAGEPEQLYVLLGWFDRSTPAPHPVQQPETEQSLF
jgi:hypothetical protein